MRFDDTLGDECVAVASTWTYLRRVLTDCIRL